MKLGSQILAISFCLVCVHLVVLNLRQRVFVFGRSFNPLDSAFKPAVRFDKPFQKLGWR